MQKKKVTQMLLRRERLSAKNGPQLLELGVCFDCCGAGVAGVDRVYVSLSEKLIL